MTSLAWSDSTLGGATAAGLVGIATRSNELVKFGPTPTLVVGPAASVPLAPPPVNPASVEKTIHYSGNVEPLFGLDIYAVLRGGDLHLVPSSAAQTVIGVTPEAYDTVRFPALLYPLAIEAGDINQDSLDDLVVATQNGQVVWLDAATLSVPSQVRILGEYYTLGKKWLGPSAPEFPMWHSTGSVVGAWGMCWGAGGPGGPIEVIDQCSRRWQVDSVTGAVAYDHTCQTVRAFPGGLEVIPLPKPMRDLCFVGSGFGPSGVGSVSDSETGQPSYDIVDVGKLDNPSATFVRVQLNSYLDYSYNQVPNAQSSVLSQHRDYQVFDEQFMPFSFGGDVLGDLSYAAGWGVRAQDAVFGYTNPMFDIDRSTTNWGLSSTGSRVQVHFRNSVDLPISAMHATQSVRLGRWGADKVRAIVSTMGGSIAAHDLRTTPTSAGGSSVDPDAYLPQSTGDHGFGGLALCVRQVRQGSGNPTIFFGTLNTHGGVSATSVPGFDMVSSLHIYDYDGGSNLQLGSSQVFENTGVPGVPTPKLFGLCGIAAGNIIDDPGSDGVEDELVLTTLNGDLLVYGLEASGTGPVTLSGLLVWEVHDGSLGANNAILIDDQDPGRAIYVAGSMGIRKFDVVYSPPF